MVVLQHLYSTIAMEFETELSWATTWRQLVPCFYGRYSRIWVYNCTLSQISWAYRCLILH